MVDAQPRSQPRSKGRGPRNEVGWCSSLVLFMTPYFLYSEDGIDVNIREFFTTCSFLQVPVEV